MAEEMMIITDGSMELKIPRSDLVSVDETHDGIIFMFKNGVHLYKTDTSMEISTKNIMKNTADNYPGKKLVFELDNPRRPVFVDAT